MKITDNKHTLSFNTGDSGAAMIMISDKLIDDAPESFKPVMNKLMNACAFLEQFGLSGHFATKRDENNNPAVSCFLVVPIELDVSDLVNDNKVNMGDKHITAIAPSLSFCLYAGLRAILGYKEQLRQDSKKIHVSDATDVIKWDGHRVLSACYTKSETDITSGVFVFEDDPDCCLKLSGSYSSMEDKLISEEGVELDAPKAIKERFRNIYGADLLEQQIREVIGNKEGD